MAIALTQHTPEAVALPKEYLSATHENAVQRLQRFTVQTAEEENVNPVIPVYVITHESDWKSSAVGDHGLAHNVAQFHETTFNWMKKKANTPQLQYDNSKDQIVLLVWALKNGLGDNWTTYKKLQ